jgi:stage II sporulation protein D
VLDARFHACCGGRTASFESVFDEPDPGSMTPVECGPCAKISPNNLPTPDGAVVWEWTAEADALDALAGSLGVGSRIRALFPVRRDHTGRWLEVRVVGDRTGHNVDTTALRQQLGFTNLKSTWIVGTHPKPGKPVDGRLTFRGRGRGHGVGFCQTGARELADSGWTARSILGKYFPSATLSRISPSPAPALLPASTRAEPAR